jgi:hypothetical protein
MKRLLIPALISLVLAMPVGGFVFGFVHCTDCGWDVLGRGFIGIVSAFLTSIFLGFPPRNEGGVGAPYNAWPYIIVAFLVVFLCSALFMNRTNDRKR